MKQFLAGLFSLLLISCAGHVEPVKVSGSEQDPKSAFCSMAERQMDANEAASKAKAAENGLELVMDITHCDLISDFAGRIYYTLKTSMGDQSVITVDAVALIVRTEEGWAVAKDTPIYVIDHINGSFSWFVKEPDSDAPRGQDI